jgi:carbon storage regulator
MLILTRRIGERILIDEGKIQIAFLYYRRGQIAFGINAPPHIDVDRKEIFLLKHKQNLE